MPKEKKIGFPLLYTIYFKFVDLKIVSFFFPRCSKFQQIASRDNHVSFWHNSFPVCCLFKPIFRKYVGQADVLFFFLAFLATDFVLL